MSVVLLPLSVASWHGRGQRPSRPAAWHRGRVTTDDDEVVVDGPETPAGPTTPHVVALRTVPWPTGQHLWRQVAGEVRWSLTPPWTWLSGVAANLVLSLLWLIWVPLRGAP